MLAALKKARTEPLSLSKKLTSYGREALHASTTILLKVSNEVYPTTAILKDVPPPSSVERSSHLLSAQLLPSATEQPPPAPLSIEIAFAVEPFQRFLEV